MHIILQKIDAAVLPSDKMLVMWDNIETIREALSEPVIPDAELVKALEIARKHAKLKPQSYYAEPFQPHEWVLDAINEALSKQPVVEYFESVGKDYFLEPDMQHVNALIQSAKENEQLRAELKAYQTARRMDGPA